MQDEKKQDTPKPVRAANKRKRESSGNVGDASEAIDASDASDESDGDNEHKDKKKVSTPKAPKSKLSKPSKATKRETSNKTHVSGISLPATATPHNDPDVTTMVTRYSKRLAYLCKSLFETDFPLDVKSDGIASQFMDPSHCVLIDFHLGNNAFFDGTIQCQKDGTTGLHVKYLNKILKSLTHDDSAHLQIVVDSTNNTFAMSAVSPHRKPGDAPPMTISHKVLELDVERMAIPASDYEWIFEMSRKMWSHFLGLLTDMDAEEFVLRAAHDDNNPCGFTLHGTCTNANGRGDCKVDFVQIVQSIDGASGKITVIKGPLAQDGRPHLQQLFASKLVLHSKKFCDVSAECRETAKIRIALADDLPMRIEVSLRPDDEWGSTDKTDQAYLRLYVAPKIQDNDVADTSISTSDEKKNE